ncbi:MAG: iron-sulfur cluster assembly scaffold protein [Dehalococcoidia bacterium]|nr:iron-sulfur cluster assembly scaffold protein [Dehalococcoidia bacterium]
MRVSREEYQQMLVTELHKIYSDETVDHALKPRNMGNIDIASGYASVTGPCGDTMEIWLSVDNKIIAEATFMTDGCVTTIAAGSMVTEMVKGKPVEEAMRIGQQDILRALNGLPEESKHCALLAANTLKEAIIDYYEYSHDKWKRSYKKQW